MNTVNTHIIYTCNVMQTSFITPNK